MRAMILAAGRGERMRPLTDTTPKPLLVAGGQPLIVWHIRALVAAGIREIVINHAWLGDRIEAALGSGTQFGAQIRYSAEAAALETAGGIAKALPLLGSQPFLVVNGDIWCDWDFNAAAVRAAALDGQQRQAWLLLVPNPPHHPRGDFHLQADRRVTRAADHRLTFSGVGVYHPSLFARITPGARMQLAPLIDEAITRAAVSGDRYDGRWTDVGTPQRLAELDTWLARRDVSQDDSKIT